MFQLIMKYFDKGLYSLADVYHFVLSGQITQEEYSTVANLTGNPDVDDILAAPDDEEELP